MNDEQNWPPFATVHTFRTSWSGSGYGYDQWPSVEHPEEEITGSEYIHRDVARAWQAFRDFLNGTPEYWHKRINQAVTYAKQPNPWSTLYQAQGGGNPYNRSGFR